MIPLLLISHSLLTANTTNQWTNYHPNSQTILSKSASDNQYDPNLDKPVVYEFNKQWYKWLAAKEKDPSNVYDGFVADTEKFTVDISNLTFQDQNLINQTVFEFELGGIDATINLPQPCQIKTPSFGISNIGGHCPSYQKYDIFGDKTTIKIEGKQLSSTSHQSIKFFNNFFSKFFVWHRDWFHAEFLIEVKLSEDQKSLIFWFYRKVESYDGHYSGDWASKGVAGFKLKKLTITKGFSYKEIYDQFHKNFSKPFSLVSNEGPSILTTNNRREIEKELAKNLNLPPKLQNHFIVNHAFEDGSSPKVITTVTFKPQNQGQVKWVFQKPISVKLADQYYQKKIEERLKITPGQIAKIVNEKQILVDDIPKKIEANGEEIWEYHTSAFLHFTPDLNNNEVLFVNGEKVGILNNIFTYQFQDQRYDFWTKKKEDKGGGGQE